MALRLGFSERIELAQGHGGHNRDEAEEIQPPPIHTRKMIGMRPRRRDAFRQVVTASATTRLLSAAAVSHGVEIAAERVHER